MYTIYLATMALAGSALAHGGDHSQKPIVDENADWMTKHMAGMPLPQTKLSAPSPPIMDSR